VTERKDHKEEMRRSRMESAGDMKAIRLLIAHSSLKTLHDPLAVLIMDRAIVHLVRHHPNLLLPHKLDDRSSIPFEGVEL
jgi:hypothetical protein